MSTSKFQGLRNLFGSTSAARKVVSSSKTGKLWSGVRRTWNLADKGITALFVWDFAESIMEYDPDDSDLTDKAWLAMEGWFALSAVSGMARKTGLFINKIVRSDRAASLFKFGLLVPTAFTGMNTLAGGKRVRTAALLRETGSILFKTTKEGWNVYASHAQKGAALLSRKAESLTASVSKSRAGQMSSVVLTASAESIKDHPRLTAAILSVVGASFVFKISKDQQEVLQGLAIDLASDEELTEEEHQQMFGAIATVLAESFDGDKERALHFLQDGSEYYGPAFVQDFASLLITDTVNANSLQILDYEGMAQAVQPALEAFANLSLVDLLQNPVLFREMLEAHNIDEEDADSVFRVVLLTKLGAKL